MQLFVSYLSTRIRFVVRKYRSVGHAVDPSVDGVESRFSCSPLLYHEYRPVSKFRGNSTTVLSRKNMFPSFEDTEHKETCMPSLSGERGEVRKTPRRIYRAYIISIYSHASCIYLVYCTLYRIQTNCGVLLEISMKRPCVRFRSMLSCHSILPIPHLHHRSKLA
jgi:hypothetical protein